MKNKILHLSFILIVLLASCNKINFGVSPSGYPSSSAQSGSGNQNQPGVVTAGEWNDLDNWTFWDSLMNSIDYKTMPAYWSFYNKNRISLRVITADSTPVVNAVVKLKRNGNAIFSARTDNKGSAELWADIFQNNTNTDFSLLTIDINNGANLISDVTPYNEGINYIVVPSAPVDNKIEISFVVDATGSMGDELEYLKTELLDVISRIKIANPDASVLTSSVFYRDEADEYVTRVSDFTSDNNITINFIREQYASGGGDFPEAVHSALDKAVNELQWSTTGKTKILYLVLDAPPHHENAVISNIQSSVLNATAKGIKIIPITASGINKETEFLMRFLAMSTNGTYVFITDDSGIGNSHLQASVGPYQVEYLNNLMVRLINKYAE